MRVTEAREKGAPWRTSRITRQGHAACFDPLRCGWEHAFFVARTTGRSGKALALSNRLKGSLGWFPLVRTNQISDSLVPHSRPRPMSERMYASPRIARSPVCIPAQIALSNEKRFLTIAFGLNCRRSRDMTAIVGRWPVRAPCPRHWFLPAIPTVCNTDRFQASFLRRLDPAG